MTTIIDAGVLDFIGFYSPPSGVGETYDFGAGDSIVSCDNLWIDSQEDSWVYSNDPGWGVCYPGFLYQIYTDENYVYAAYSEGLDVIDLFLEAKVAYADHKYGFTSVCGDSDRVYLGTLTSGIKYIDKTCISGSYSYPYDLTDCLNDFDGPYNPSSDRIRSLFLRDNNLSVVTLEGIDIIGMEPGREYHSSTTSSGIIRSFLTSKRELYYIIHDSTTMSGVAKIGLISHDWDYPDTFYSAGDSFLSGEMVVKDIFVTTNTAEDSQNNTLFVATSSGIFILDEGSGESKVYYTSN
jgi:hypothetical protein